jgi:hypothetical protein
MKILRKGHRYQLDGFEKTHTGTQIIQFIEKEKEQGSDELTTIYDGTTNEEVLAMLINRMNYLQDKFPCRENAMAITKLDEALMWLNKRTTDRIQRGVEGKHIK